MPRIDFPTAAGTYAIVMAALQPTTVMVGRLGPCVLPGGFLVYVGTARGPGGLRSRIARHLRPDKPLRWHVDYLTAQLPVVHVVALATAENLECEWTRRLLALPSAAAPIAGFGSSDCCTGCPAHLIRLPAEFDLTTLEDVLRG